MFFNNIFGKKKTDQESPQNIPESEHDNEQDGFLILGNTPSDQTAVRDGAKTDDLPPSYPVEGVAMQQGGGNMYPIQPLSVSTGQSTTGVSGSGPHILEGVPFSLNSSLTAFQELHEVAEEASNCLGNLRCDSGQDKDTYSFHLEHSVLREFSTGSADCILDGTAD